MDEPELDRMLGSEEPLVPSSGFAARVMEAVRETTVTAPPLPFPWGRFAAGVVMCTALAASTVLFLTYVDLFVLDAPISVLAAFAPEVGYAAAVCFGTFVVLRVQRVLAARD
jgi:hypothetical protein